MQDAVRHRLELLLTAILLPTMNFVRREVKEANGTSDSSLGMACMRLFAALSAPVMGTCARVHVHGVTLVIWCNMCFRHPKATTVIFSFACTLSRSFCQQCRQAQSMRPESWLGDFHAVLGALVIMSLTHLAGCLGPQQPINVYP